jgi:hypothetical protein
VSAPAGAARSSPAHRIVTTRRPPPANARVTRVGTASTLEATNEGVGTGSTLADARRTQPHGHLLVFGVPIAWLVDGAGRRRTAFMIYKGVVQSVQIGCRQTDPAHPSTMRPCAERAFRPVLSSAGLGLARRSFMAPA